MSSLSRYGTVLILSGPSGSGKSTLSSRALAEFPTLGFSISCTTRAPRGEEKDGVDYYFLTKEKFEEHIANGDFLEYACVHGNFYGTLRSEVAKRVEEGKDVLLDIDVQGAQKILEKAKSDPLLAKCVETVFIAPPSCTELERRLRGRGTDSEESILKRLGNARMEMACFHKYDFLIINDDVEKAYEKFKSLVLTMQNSTRRLKEEPFHE